MDQEGLTCGQQEHQKINPRVGKSLMGKWRYLTRSQPIVMQDHKLGTA